MVCSGVTGSTWPGRGGLFDLRSGSLLLPWGASCLCPAARRSPKEESKGSVGQTHHLSYARKSDCDRELDKNTSRSFKINFKIKILYQPIFFPSTCFKVKFYIAHLKTTRVDWPKCWTIYSKTEHKVKLVIPASPFSCCYIQFICYLKY